MRTSGQRRSSNYEDRRGQPRGGGGFSPQGGGSFLPLLLMQLFRGRGGKGILLLLLLLFLFSRLFASTPVEKPQPTRAPTRASVSVEEKDRAEGPADQAEKDHKFAHADEEELKDYLLVVLASTEDVWDQLFREVGLEYEPTTLVFFTDYVQSACGMTSSATGPFYCPADSKVYIDLGFFRELADRFGAEGDFPIAYVLAHEVGHHVQNQLGVTDQIARLRQTSSKQEINRMTVRVELQADYYAGVWAHHADNLNLLEEGDVEEAIGAALAIGDDRLQREATGRVSPENFTHGTSEQRARWFQKGYKFGDIEHGNNAFDLAYDQLRR